MRRTDAPPRGGASRPVLWAGLLLALVVGLGSAAGVALMPRGFARDTAGFGAVRFAPHDMSGQVTVEVILPGATEARPAAPLLAHYTEHLAWLNSIGDGARDSDRESNAWTSAEAVAYWLTGDAEDLTEILASLAGVFDPLDLAPEFATEERDILAREYDLRVGADPQTRAEIGLDAFLYAGGPRAVSPAGTPETIAALRYEDAVAFHAATHSRARATLLVRGDVTERQLRRALAALPAADPAASPVPPAPAPVPFAGPGRQRETLADPGAPPRLIWRRLVALDSPVDFDLLEARLFLLRDLLDSALPGGLAGPLRYDAQVARGFDVTILPVDEAHFELRIGAEPDSGVSLAALETALEAALEASAETGIPAETFDRVRKRFDSFLPDWDDPEARDDWIADYTLDRAEGLRAPLGRAALRALEPALTRASVDALLQAIVSAPARTAIAHLGPPEMFQ